MIFSCIFYTWFILAHSFDNGLENTLYKLRRFLFGLNVFIILLLITVYILIIKDINVYSIAEIIWCSIMSITCAWITIYAIRVGKVLYITVQISQQQKFYESDWRDVKRLLTINGVLTSFFIFQTAATIYFTAFHQKLDSYFRITDLFTNAVCLTVLCYLYRNPMKR